VVEPVASSFGESAAGDRRRRSGRTGWICCAGSGSRGTSGWSEIRRPGSRRAISSGGCRSRSSQRERIGAIRPATDTPRGPAVLVERSEALTLRPDGPQLVTSETVHCRGRRSPPDSPARLSPSASPRDDTPHHGACRSASATSNMLPKLRIA
jgi:hypothetical protein